MPDTVPDDDEESDVTPTDDVESAAPVENVQGGVKFGWIRGVLVSYVGSRQVLSTLWKLFLCIQPV